MEKVNRRKRRADMATFRAEQIKAREAAAEGRLYGDAPLAPLPKYFLDHLKNLKGAKA